MWRTGIQDGEVSQEAESGVGADGDAVGGAGVGVEVPLAVARRQPADGLQARAVGNDFNVRVAVQGCLIGEVVRSAWRWEDVRCLSLVFQPKPIYQKILRDF